ncbi:MAG TPA: polysaccharide biosynthesis C-terminal domain-containing protein, partial [Prolixibacteraceae bacterium]|nr:polysaccharide biosynthesis C-terminal domain-containing protein [Prolixibacteraceae bacterium]
LMAGLLLPMFSGMIKRKEALGSMIQLAFVLLFVPAIVTAVSTLFYSREIMELLYHSHIDDSVNMLGLLMTGFPGIALTYVFGTLLTANGSLKHLNIMAFLGMLLNIALNLILIPTLYGKGSAIASMVTQLATGIAQLAISIWLFRIRINYPFVSKLLIFAIMVILAASLSRLMDNRLAGYLLTIALGGVFALSLRLIQPKEFFLLFKKEP